MNGDLAPGSPAPSGWRGVLTAWIQGWSHQPQDRNCAQPDLGSALGGAASVRVQVRVLVADDNPVNLALISALLERRGLVPELASNGAEAVTLACDGPFDLVLMDMQMPVLDGLSATAAIRRCETTSARAAVPVLAYSSACPNAAVLAAYGVSGSLDKPCTDQDLEDCLVQWCPTYVPRHSTHAADPVVRRPGRAEPVRDALNE